MTISDSNLWLFNTYLEQYKVWSNHINNFSSHLGLHLLLMFYQYKQNPPDTIDIVKFSTPQGGHKIFFDTFAEDSALYLISYFDKHLEMFNDLYNLKENSGLSRKLTRNAIIREMKKIDALTEISDAYRAVEQSQAFKQIKEIRNNFVHNKSSSHYGMDVEKIAGSVYSSGHSKGISTETTYMTVRTVVVEYGNLCEKVNGFISRIIERTPPEDT